MSEIIIQKYTIADIEPMRTLWNQIIEDGVAFPGDIPLPYNEMQDMLAQQTAAMCAWQGEVLAGLYILHPNNIGRCSHVANASYAVSSAFRGQGVGRRLVESSLREAKQHGFRGMQFNAVVAGNTAALAIYKQFSFTTVGTIPGGFLLKDGRYSDMYVMYKDLEL